MSNWHFSGWATRNDLLCGDGRTIRKDAFKDNDGKTVPLIWNHEHADPLAVLGHALLENREDGVYAYCEFNDTEAGQAAKELVKHGDVRSLSIWANKLKQIGGDVIHGNIRELSLVLAGANPGAFIDTVMAHGDESEDCLIISYDENIMLHHSDEGSEKGDTEVSEENKTIGDLYQEQNFTPEQEEFVQALVGMALEHSGMDDEVEEIEIDEELEEEYEEEIIEHGDSEGGNEFMTRNAFEQNGTVQRPQNVLSHADVEAIFQDAKRCGSLAEAYLAHAESLAHADGEGNVGGIEYATKTQNYGFNTPDFLFPEARALNNPPEFIKRDMDWVQKVMRGVHHTPFSRIKSVFADITEDDARAKGYIKGKMKKEEVFGLLKRTTTPTTVYKKQKMDRDDLIDITDFDVVAWLKGEMRMMLDEELARAVLVGDGRPNSSDDKINELNIRPILGDEDLFTIKANVTVASGATADEKAKAFIRTVVKTRKDYKGSGSPTLYTTEDVLTDCLLMEDTTGRVIYDTIDKLKNVLRVSEIVTVPVMEGLKGKNGGDLMGIIVNLKDYNVGADKGGAVNMFDDFDIDYNQQKYLIETRCSGALTKPYSAIALELSTGAGE